MWNFLIISYLLHCVHHFQALNLLNGHSECGSLSTDFRPKLKSQNATFVRASLRRKKENFLEAFLILRIFFNGQISKFQTKLDEYSLWIRRSYNTQTRLISSHRLINFYKGPSTNMLSACLQIKAVQPVLGIQKMPGCLLSGQISHILLALSLSYYLFVFTIIGEWNVSSS